MSIRQKLLDAVLTKPHNDCVAKCFGLAASWRVVRRNRNVNIKLAA